jgi:predicted Rossmann fold nucleotide-binding protein DprA/Smf involved in DNA uptake
VSSVVVVEAPFRSGVQHTVSVAAEAGRDVWVVPQRPDSEVGRAAAAHLFDGAFPLTDVGDLLAHLGVAPDRGVRDPRADRSARRSAAHAEDPTERAIAHHLALEGASTVDDLRGCGVTTLAVLSAIARLESRRVIDRDAGGRWRLR